MFYKINKFFKKIFSSFISILLKLLLVSILFLKSESTLSKVTNIERDLAYKYCDSLEKNLFKGLDNEIILKYEYFFSSLNSEVLNESGDNLSNFASEVETFCSYKINDAELREMRQLLNKFISSN